jgi:hypothetical protein
MLPNRFGTLAAPLRPWTAFAARRNRPYQVISVSQAVLSAFATDALFVPFLLVLGANPALVMLVGMLPVLGSAAQALIPATLRRTGGDLRGITIVLTALGETRGIWFAAVATGVALRAIPDGAAIALVAAIVLIANSGALVAEATLFSWLAIVLPDAERRTVTPKMMGMTAGASAVILLPAGIALSSLGPFLASWLYAAFFATSFLASLPLLRTMTRLPHPGRVTIPRAAAAPAPTPALRSFMRASAWNAAGIGLTPYFGVFAVAVLGMSPGFAVVLSGVWALASLLTGVVVGAVMAQVSSAWLLRTAYAVRGAGMVLCLAAFPGNGAAGAVLLAAVTVSAVGYSASVLAQTERLFRLTAGPALVSAQATMTARNAAAFTAGGLLLSGSTVLGEGIGFPAWAGMFVASALPRFIAARGTEAPASWRTSPTPGVTAALAATADPVLAPAAAATSA